MFGCKYLVVAKKLSFLRSSNNVASDVYVDLTKRWYNIIDTAGINITGTLIEDVECCAYIPWLDNQSNTLRKAGWSRDSQASENVLRNTRMTSSAAVRILPVNIHEVDKMQIIGENAWVDNLYNALAKAEWSRDFQAFENLLRNTAMTSATVRILPVQTLAR